jgi:hypothetical protein
MQGFYLGAQMNGSDKRRWFRVAPPGVSFLGSGRSFLARRRCRLTVTLSICLPAVPASNYSAPTTFPSGSNFFTATHDASARSRGREVFALA